ncbi:hypothetical protein AAEU32_09910 [Pseudoalteromonas sp. SSDWG2]|uniref:hypothetical protein n=1 Tax=Pseudoalteromonas sp. SSDWG2 TaxID=3139391 RepID=UPI003BABDDBE
MGARQSVFEEFLNNRFADHCSAEQVRLAIAEAIKHAQNKTEQYFELLSKFNDNHSRVLYHNPSSEPELVFYHHKLFKEVTYEKASVHAWAKKWGVELTL